MWGKLLLAGVLVCVAGPVAAGPVVPIVVSIGAAWGTAALTAGMSVLAAAAIQVGVGIAVSFVLSKFMQPKVPGFPDVNFNPAQPVSHMERVYGMVRKGGPKGFTKFARFTGWPGRGSKREYRATIVILAAHQVDGIEEWYIDDRRVTMDGNDWASGRPYAYGWVGARFYDGSQTQTVDAKLNSRIGEWTEAHDMAGLAYIVAFAKRLDEDNFNEIYPNGHPVWTPVVRGNADIFDPRTGIRGYTRNWALCFAHELTHYQGLDVDWDEVAYEADQCDALVVAEQGQMRSRWLFDGFFADDMEHAAIRQTFLTAANGWFYERVDGKVGFKAGRWIEPAITLTRADFLSVQISSVIDIDAANEYTVQYIEPDRKYVSTPTGVWIHDPDGNRTRKEIKAEAVNRYHQAVALAKRQSREEHARYRISGTLKHVGLAVRGERFVAIDLSDMGLSCMAEVKVLDMSEDWTTFAFEGVSTEAGDWLVELDEYPQRPQYGATESSVEIDPITSLQVSYGTSSSSGAAALVATWVEEEDSYRQQLRWSVSGSEAWNVVDIPADVRRFEATGLVDGQDYEFQIRNVRSGKYSTWSDVVLATAVSDSTPPPALPRFEVTGGSGRATIAFDTPNSPNYSGIRIYRGTGTSFAVATLIATSYGSPNSSDDWMDGGLDDGTYSYWGVPINRSGVRGPASGPETVTVT